MLASTPLSNPLSLERQSSHDPGRGSRLRLRTCCRSERRSFSANSGCETDLWAVWLSITANRAWRSRTTAPNRVACSYKRLASWLPYASLLAWAIRFLIASRSRAFFAVMPSVESPVSSDRLLEVLAVEPRRERVNRGKCGEEGVRRMAPRRCRGMELGPSPEGRLAELIVEIPSKWYQILVGQLYCWASSQRRRSW